jgi:DNA-binding NtrC family response regulator
MLDDEPYITLIFRKALNLLGYTVNAYNDPSVALGNFKPDYHDLVILDYRMRGINEVELAQAISKIQPETKICFMSAFEVLTDEVETAFNERILHLCQKTHHAKSTCSAD